MFKKISTTIINLLFKCLLKWGILHLAKILFAILFPLYLASLIKNELEDAKNSIYHSKTNILQKWLKYTRYGI